MAINSLMEDFSSLDTSSLVDKVKAKLVQLL